MPYASRIMGIKDFINEMLKRMTMDELLHLLKEEDDITSAYMKLKGLDFGYCQYAAEIIYEVARRKGLEATISATTFYEGVSQTAHAYTTVLFSEGPRVVDPILELYSVDPDYHYNYMIKDFKKDTRIITHISNKNMFRALETMLKDKDYLGGLHGGMA